MIVCALNRALVERHDNGGVPAVTLAALEREAALLAFARTGLTRRDERLRRATVASSPAVGRTSRLKTQAAALSESERTAFV